MNGTNVGLQRQAQFAEMRDHGEKVGARVALVERRRIASSTDSTAVVDEQAAGVAQRRDRCSGVAAAGARS